MSFSFKRLTYKQKDRIYLLVDVLEAKCSTVEKKVCTWAVELKYKTTIWLQTANEAMSWIFIAIKFWNLD